MADAKNRHEKTHPTKREYTVQEAEQHFEEILRDAEAGNTIVITRNNTPIAQLTPINDESESNQHKEPTMRFMPDLALPVTNPQAVTQLLTTYFGGHVEKQCDTETRVQLRGLALNLEHVAETAHTVWVTVTVAASDLDQLTAQLTTAQPTAVQCTCTPVTDPAGGVLCDTGHGLGFLLDPV